MGDGSAGFTAVKRHNEILMWPLKLRGGKDFNYALAPGAPWERASMSPPVYSVAAHIRYAEFVYFHPFVQRFLYDDGKDAAIKVFKRSDVKKAEVTLRAGEEGSRVILDVNRIELYLFPNERIAIMAMEVMGSDMPLGVVQDLQDQFRRAYPPFWFNNGNAGLCPAKVQWLGAEGSPVGPESNYDDIRRHYDFARQGSAPPASSHWAWLLEPWRPYAGKENGDGGISFQQLEDERIPFMSHIAFDDPARLTEGDFIRLAFADARGLSNSLPYGTDFMRDFKKDYCYDRFWDPKTPGHGYMTSRMMCSGYACVFIGESGEENKSFFSTLLLDHFRRHYFLMGLIAHFHRAALLSFSGDISETVKILGHKPSPEFRKAIREILRRYLRFTNIFWFPEISNQMQPKEMFTMWSQKLGTEKLYHELLDEIKNVSEYLNAHYGERLNTFLLIFAIVSIIGSALNVTSSIAWAWSLSATAVLFFIGWILYKWKVSEIL
jgi:hypothetical protein